jgi:hypothetical protein
MVNLPGRKNPTNKVNIKALYCDVVDSKGLGERVVGGQGGNAFPA